MFMRLLDLKGREVFLRGEDFSASFLEDWGDGATRTVVCVRGYISTDDGGDGNLRVQEFPDQVLMVAMAAMGDTEVRTWRWWPDEGKVDVWERPFYVDGPTPTPVPPAWLLGDANV